MSYRFLVTVNGAHHSRHWVPEDAVTEAFHRAEELTGTRYKILATGPDTLPLLTLTGPDLDKPQLIASRGLADEDSGWYRANTWSYPEGVGYTGDDRVGTSYSTMYLNDAHPGLRIVEEVYVAETTYDDHPARYAPSCYTSYERQSGDDYDTISDGPDHERFMHDFDNLDEAISVIRIDAANPACAHTWAGEPIDALV